MIAIFRILFIVASVIFTTLYYIDVSLTAVVIGGVVSAVAALAIIIVIEYVSHTFSTRILLAALLGLFIGLIFSHLLVIAFVSMPLPISPESLSVMKGLIYHIIGFATMLFFVINNDSISLLDYIIPEKTEEGRESGIAYKILDTSVIIDGRIADICDTGFIEGILVIPNFVLNELQMIADSADSIKRNRGRRGLDILNKMQKDQSIMVKISDMDFPEIHEVDAKLVKMAKVMKAMVITNDFNLNKVAEFHGVKVLNINQLSNALKPIVLPGEEMKVALIKEGKDSNQAIGYLDDGTMVVVENGRRRLGHEVDVIVTSVLQTTAGRMIFARIRED
ncbi:MAG TPA: TRAM domain-containing protein [Spirochaetota bacterium]|nr:MAG: putative PIN and TRAM-domain containing protein precursor [Spirochaetes bacterium ADurb.BinA120]HNU90342.1 TRAM domain-containing protein [Spirochaetota bacterium]HPI13132.1 TRAM domain-containing protein [Spirochaetota bacterium]HPO45300.1 TRAM domain-containing protein [Spirochaetota bacterium]HPV96465.1 TRAM domain-containing protein [Spirochaetota bacterium]